MKRDQRAAETDGIIENAPAKRWYHLQLHIATLVTSCAVWGGRREGPCTTLETRRTYQHEHLQIHAVHIACALVIM